MKQVININFQGRVVPIEVTAFDLLKNYTESLSRHFANEEGKEEIINDIESRIGELFQERIKNGATCITDDDVNAIINSMGRPEDFETDQTGASSATTASASTEQKNNSQQQQQSSGAAGTHKRLYRDENNKILGGVCAGIANYFGIDTTLVRILFVLTGIGFLAYILLWAFVPSNADGVIGITRKKLYRDNDDKIIAGVCSGIGHYFGINPWIPRILFALPFLSIAFRWGHWGAFDFPDFLRISFSPGALILYIILWVVLPEALTTAEKLEMKGEKVDLNSIKESVKEEMKDFQQRAEKIGKEASAYAKDKAQAITEEAKNFSRRHRSGFGDIIATIAKVFAYFIIGCVCFALVMAAFALGIVSIGLFPLKDFIVRDGWQNAYAWGTLLFFVAVPIVGIIIWLVRKLAKAKGNSKILRASFISLWILGWVCFVLLLSSVSREFKYRNKNIAEQEIILSNPKVNKLEITSSSPLDKYTRNRWLRFEPFEGLDEDTAYVKNYQVFIEKSPNDSFKVSIIKMSDGRSRAEAERLATMIQFGGIQKDSVLTLDKGIAINKTDKFRNQYVVIKVYVPVGKHIKIDKSVGWFNHVRFSGPWNNEDDFAIFFDNDGQNWEANTEYEMKADGNLYTLNGIKASDRYKYNRNYNNRNTDNYRYYENEEQRRESREDSIEKRNQFKIDSIERRNDWIKDSLDRKMEMDKEKLLKGGEPEPSAFIITVGPAGMQTIM